MMLAIKFLVRLDPQFKRYLTIFQAEYTMVHCLHTKMKDLLVAMKRFRQSSALDGKSTNDLLKVYVA